MTSSTDAAVKFSAQYFQVKEPSEVLYFLHVHPSALFIANQNPAVIPKLPPKQADHLQMCKSASARTPKRKRTGEEARQARLDEFKNALKKIAKDRQCKLPVTQRVQLTVLAMTNARETTSSLRDSHYLLTKNKIAECAGSITRGKGTVTAQRVAPSYFLDKCEEGFYFQEKGTGKSKEFIVTTKGRQEFSGLESALIMELAKEFMLKDAGIHDLPNLG